MNPFEAWEILGACTRRIGQGPSISICCISYIARGTSWFESFLFSTEDVESRKSINILLFCIKDIRLLEHCRARQTITVARALAGSGIEEEDYPIVFLGH